MDHPSAFEDGDYSAGARDISRVWAPAKNSVRDIFNSANQSDRFTIILFQDRVLDVCDGIKSEIAWTTIDSRMERAIQNGGNTCILSAWDRAEHYFSNSTDTVFYLITDGVEDHGSDTGWANSDTEELCRRIRSFCATHNNTQGFYTNLVRSLHDQKNNPINRALETSACFKTKIGGRFDERIVFDMDDISRNFSQDKFLVFHPTDKAQANVNNIITHCSDRYFKVSCKNGRIEQNKLELHIEYKGDTPLEELGVGNNYSFNVDIQSLPDAKHQIYSQTVRVVVNFKLARVAFLPQTRLEGKSVYQKPFKLIEGLFPGIAAEKKPTLIIFDFRKIVAELGQELFNAEARRQGAEISLRLRSKNSKPIPLLTIRYNGEECGNIITIKSSDSKSVVEIEFDKNADPRRYNYLQFAVEGNPKNLDRINSDVCSAYCNDVDLSFVSRSNPWYVSVIWFIILVVIIVFARIIYANFPTRKMNGQLLPEDSYSLLLQGKVRGVLTSKRQSQSFLSELFNGPIVYSTPDGFWTSDLIIKRGRRYDMISILPCDNYVIDGEVRKTPYTIRKHEDFTVENIATGKKLIINYL